MHNRPEQPWFEIGTSGAVWRHGALALTLAAACGDSGGDGTGSSESSGSSTSSTGDSMTVTPGSSSTASGGSTAADTTGPPPGTETGTTEDSSSSGGPEPEGTFWVFVAANTQVTTWSMDPADGALTFERSLDLGGNLGPLAMDPEGQHLYVGLLNDERADAFVIDQVTADLSANGSVDVGFRPVYLATDQTGQHLLTTTFGDDELAIFPIGGDGSLGGAETERLATPEEPHSIITDVTNQWLLVPHRTPDVVGQYQFDAGAGTVTPNAVPQVVANAGAGPRHIVMHPDNTHAYVADEFADSVSTYAFDETTGQLTLEGTVTTLPDDAPGDTNTCADIHITPDARFVYVSNRGHDSIAVFQVDAATGALSAAGEAPTEPRPREFDVSPRGRYLYAAGQDSGMLASYTIDQDNGSLTAGPVYDVGEGPRWVLTVELPPME